MSRPEFAISDFDEVIQEHDSNILRLRNWRENFSAHAEDLTDFLLTYPALGNVQGGGGGSSRRRRLVSCFQGERSFQGHRASFDPWNGVWQGAWRSGGNSSPQYHLWDLTSERLGQFVQPVTQSTSAFVTKNNLANMKARASVDLGINVWSPNNGLTGWVSKRQNNDPHELPHIAYSPSPRSLIWIAQRDFAGNFWMFYEWVNSAGTQYGIFGRWFQLNARGVHRGGDLGQASYNSVPRSTIEPPGSGRATQGNCRRHPVVSGESLSLITRRYWDDMMLFPLIYDANADVIGENWNLIHPGMVLTIPPKSSYSAAELAAARQRARSG